MGAFSQVVRREAEAPRPAARIATLPTNAFADTWSGKPKSPVKVGVRLLSDKDVEVARAEAARKAFALHPRGQDDPNFVDAFNDALMRTAVAFGTCRPENVALPYFDVAEDMVWVALTSFGVKRLYEELESLALESSPLTPEASDDDLADMAGALAAGDFWARMPLHEAERVRRLLGAVVERIAPYDVG